MTPHAHFEALLVCSDELTLAERMRLEAHLAGCAACRSLEALYAENRSRLRAMAQVRPPEELRTAILAAAESSRPVLGGMAMLLPFAIIPATLVMIGLAVAYGPVAWLVVGVVLVAFVVATAWALDRREARARERPLTPEPGLGLGEIARAIGWDAAGIAIGLGLIGLLLMAAMLSGGQ